MRMIVTIASLGLCACTTTPTMESALAPLTGQPVQLVVEQLGPPSSTSPYGANTIYLWHHAKLVHGTPSRNSLPPSAGENSGTYGGMAVPYSCEVRILTDPTGRIIDTQYGQETGGCRESARKLHQLALADAP